LQTPDRIIYSGKKFRKAAMKKILFIAALSLFFCLNAGMCAAQELLSDSINSAVAVKAGDKIIIDGFYFDDGSAAVNVNLKKYLQKIAGEIKKIKYAKIYVDGYTDNRGNNSANNRLSRERANGVKNELVKNGISSKKIQARAYGSSNPIAPNNTKTGRIQNRRIEITVN
jgi:outer membrane protein OmpA-like peptidoglycan-associated protein